MSSVKKERFSVLVYQNSRLPSLELQARNFSLAKMIARTQMSQGYQGVQIKQNIGFIHGKPTRWTFDRKKMDWTPLAIFDETEAGNRVPNGSGGLFAGV